MQYPGKKRDRTHASIMHTAKALFEEQGLENVTADDIADRSGICRSTFFNHFASLKDLMLQIAEEEIEDLLQIDDGGYEGIRLIERLMDKLVDDTINYPYLFTKLTTTVIATPDADNALMRLEDILTRELDKLPITGGLSTTELSAMIMGTYYGAVNHNLIYRLPFGDGSEVKKTIHRAIRLLCK